MRFFVLGLLVATTLSPALPALSVQPATVVAQAGSSSNSYNTSAGPFFTLPQWSDGGGWTASEYYATIQLADIDGDGADELLARGPSGMMVQSWDTAAGIWKNVADSGPFTDAGGWGSSPAYYATIQFADIDGDGAEELLARGAGGLQVEKWDASNGVWTSIATSGRFPDSGGWSDPKFYQTIQTADIDGDGAAELLARGSAGIETFAWNGAGWTLLASANPAWSNAAGWGTPDRYTTIQTADIDGDGSAELLARNSAGIETFAWNGTGWQLLSSANPGYSDARGWTNPQYYTTIQTGDVDGDGAAELLARNGAGIEAFTWQGTGWTQIASAEPALSNAEGWNAPDLYATIQTGDISGDGAAELIARGVHGIQTYGWNGGGWTTLAMSHPALKDDYWDEAANYLTIQTGDIDGDGDADLLARGIYGVRTWSWNDVTANAWDNPVPYGFTAFAGDQLTAYNYIGTYLVLPRGNTVRGQYASNPTILAEFRACLLGGSDSGGWSAWTALPTETCSLVGPQTSITPPSGLALDDWNVVAEQIYDELGQAISVSTYFGDLTTLFNGVFAYDYETHGTISETLLNKDMSNTSVSVDFRDLFLPPFKLSSDGGSVASAVAATLAALISSGLETSGATTYDGKWADSYPTYSTLLQWIGYAVSGGRGYVLGDAGLMSYVAQQEASGAWDPSSDWVSRYLTSAGRQQFALWTYHALTPSIWKLRYFSVEAGECSSSAFPHPGDIRYYFVGANSTGNCWSQIRDADTESLELILDADNCVPTENNGVIWDYGSCNLGVPKTDFFLNRNGWNFDVSYKCTDTGKSSPCAGANATMVVQPGSANPTINLGDHGSVAVAIMSTASFNARDVISTSLELEGASPAGWWAEEDDWHSSRIQDVNGDGRDDVVASFLINELEVEAGTVALVLTGQMTDGSWFSLWDTVVVNPAAE